MVHQLKPPKPKQEWEIEQESLSNQEQDQDLTLAEIEARALLKILEQEAKEGLGQPGSNSRETRMPVSFLKAWLDL